MATRLSVTATLDRPYVRASRFEDEPIFALIDLQPSSDGTVTQRAPLNLCLVIDASASMYNFQLTEEEREYWMGLALSRDEMERGEADEREAIYWSGQTLEEMQSAVRKPMTMAIDAIKELLQRLQYGDKVSVIAFADHPHAVFTSEEWTTEPESCVSRLDALSMQRLPVDIGSGTRLGQPLNMAAEIIAHQATKSTVNRVIVLSDGIIQDARETGHAVDQLQEHGYAVTTIGVGDEFDEEFLMLAADHTRGAYYYAHDIHAITEQLMQELVVIESTAVRQLYVAVQGQLGSVVQDIYLARPNMTVFDEVDAEGGWVRARVGDIPTDVVTSLLVQIAATTLSSGVHPLLEIQLSWQSLEAGNTLSPPLSQSEIVPATFSDNESLLAERNQDVEELVDRFRVYKYEREAQVAQSRGDIDKAREKLGAATRELRKMGEDSLAQDLEAEIASLGSVQSDPSRAKRIKATTRRLGSKAAEVDNVPVT